uniref:Thyroxine-binding globulin n=1 Tax=Sander lucioperca TaxID=283035 RepID=A0A8C9Z8U2_SANLU
ILVLGLYSDGSANSVSLVNEANKDFSFRLYRKLAAHTDSQGKNIFFSPASVSTALAALSVGAQGETHRQLFSGLGFNSSLLTQTDVDQAFQTFLQRANNTNEAGVPADPEAVILRRWVQCGLHQNQRKRPPFNPKKVI